MLFYIFMTSYTVCLLMDVLSFLRRLSYLPLSIATPRKYSFMRHSTEEPLVLLMLSLLQDISYNSHFTSMGPPVEKMKEF
jgi:hypothetical protein